MATRLTWSFVLSAINAYQYHPSQIAVAECHAPKCLTHSGVSYIQVLIHSVSRTSECLLIQCPMSPNVYSFSASRTQVCIFVQCLMPLSVSHLQVPIQSVSIQSVSIQSVSIQSVSIQSVSCISECLTPPSVYSFSVLHI